MIEEIQENTGPDSRRLKSDAPLVCKLHFQNEYLTCEMMPDTLGSGGEVLALVPDLISVLESETGVETNFRDAFFYYSIHTKVCQDSLRTNTEKIGVKQRHALSAGRAIGSEELKYGQRCSIVAIPCAPLLTSASALDVVGPQAFGLPDVYEPGRVGEYKTPTPAFGGTSKL